MEFSELRAKVIQEVHLLPEDKLAELYNLIHYFRLGLEASQSSQKQIMQFAGCWKDMPDEVFADFSKEIIMMRRQHAFVGRHRGETGTD